MPVEASEKTKRLFSIFKEAIQREREAQSLYRQAAELCDDPAARRILEEFQRDELRHEKALMERYALLRTQYNDAS